MVPPASRAMDRSSSSATTSRADIPTTTTGSRPTTSRIMPDRVVWLTVRKTHAWPHDPFGA